jgi:hypothetical protein
VNRSAQNKKTHPEPMTRGELRTAANIFPIFIFGTILALAYGIYFMIKADPNKVFSGLVRIALLISGSKSPRKKK